MIIVSIILTLFDFCFGVFLLWQKRIFLSYYKEKRKILLVKKNNHLAFILIGLGCFTCIAIFLRLLYLIFLIAIISMVIAFFYLLNLIGILNSSQDK